MPSVQRSGFVVNGFCGFKVKSDLTTKARRMKDEEGRSRPKTQKIILLGKPKTLFYFLTLLSFLIF